MTFGIITDISKSGLIHAMRPGARVPWVDGEREDHEHEEVRKRQRIPAAGHPRFFAIYFPNLSSFYARVKWFDEQERGLNTL